MTDHVNDLDRNTLMALVDASHTIISAMEIGEVFKRIAERAASVLQAEGASVLLFDPDRKQLVFQTAVGPGADMLVGERFDAELGIAGQTIKTQRAVRIDDVRQNRHFFPGIDARTHLRTRGLMAAPLIHQGQVLGVVEVLNPHDRDAFTKHDLELLRIFANLVAAAAASAQAYDQVERQNRGLREADPGGAIVGRSQSIARAMELCRKVAHAESTVLLYGETGVGKELAARAIHNASPRHDKPFIPINCAALPESLLESELFGHEQGAFTGATGQKLGRFELANGGTLFLDEIGELSSAIQAKLLRVLQEREFIRVGGTQTITCDVRILAATNRDLKHEMTEGRFRDDLYYRLCVFPITLPPLRQRLEDIPILVEHFVVQLAPTLNIQPPAVSEDAMRQLMAYPWPGNIRELRNVIERSLLLAGDGEIESQNLPPEIATPLNVATHSHTSNNTNDSNVPNASIDQNNSDPSNSSKLDEHERTLIYRALEQADWNQSAAARNLGISRDHLRYRVKKYKLKSPKTSS